MMLACSNARSLQLACQGVRLLVMIVFYITFPVHYIVTIH